jgi:hypothetical protein
MAEKKINTVLYDIDQSSDTSDAQKATARANIGAQAELTAGDNIEIDPETNTISSTSDPQVQADWTQTDDSEVDYIKNKPNIPVIHTTENPVLVDKIDNVAIYADRAERDQYGNKLILDQKDVTYQSPQYVSGLGYHVNLSGAPEGLSASFRLIFRTDSSDTEHVQSLAKTHTVIEFTLSTADWTSYMVFAVEIEDTEVPLKNLPPILYKGAHVLIDIQGGEGVVNVLYPGQINDVQVIEYGATDIDTKRAINNIRRMKPLLCRFDVIEKKINPTPTEGYTYYPMYAILEKPYISVSPEGGHVNGCTFIAYHTVVYNINGYPASFTAGTRLKIVITCDIVNDALTWKKEMTPANECFLATFDTTTFAEILAAHDAGLPVFAIHDDQQYGLAIIASDNSHPGYRAAVFSGIRRSWLPMEQGNPCMAELICLEYDSQWAHESRPLIPITIVPDSTPYTPSSDYADGTTLRVINKLYTALQVDTVVGYVSVTTGNYINLYKYNGSWYWN